MSINISHRSGCRVCSSKNVKSFLNLPNMPFTDDFVSNENLGQEFCADINIYVCLDCFATQTQHDVDVADYYQNYQYSVGSSRFATTFMSNLATVCIENYFKQVPKPRVLEIGSGDGEQLIFFKKLGCDVLGYEPSSYLVEFAIKKGVPTIQGLFDKDSINKLPNNFQKVDIILLSYTFDHIPEPIELLKAVNKILDDRQGILIIEVHDLEKIFERSEFCLFEHEHSIYLTPSNAQSLLSFEGFSIINLDILPEQSRRANSLLFVATKNDSLLSTFKVDVIKKSDFNRFDFYKNQASLIKERIKNLESFIDTRNRQGRKIAGYGAGGRGVMTLSAINNASSLEYLVDKNPKGENIFTPKSYVPVFGINKLNEDPVDDIIVFSFGYMKEIKEDLKIFGYSSEQFYSMIDILTGKVS
jgi:SAM-dependent methyltransferase